MIIMKDIENLILETDCNHPLKKALLCEHRYYLDFLNAMNIFKDRLETKDYEGLIKKLNFEKEFDIYRYLQITSEINVLYYILRNYSDDFIYEPMYNNGYNPECSFRYFNKTVNVEVKCPNMKRRNESEQRNTLKLGFLERTENHKELVKDITDILKPSIENTDYTDIEETYRMDNKLKDFLISAQSKFPESNDENFNVLVICLEIIGDLDEWYSYIFGGTGVFTDRPFIEAAKYDRVDAILLTTPLCGHLRWEYYDYCDVWKLEETNNLLFINPDREKTKTGKFYFDKGIGLFSDLTEEFLEYQIELDEENKTKDIDDEIKYLDFKITDSKIISKFLGKQEQKKLSQNS